MAHLNVSDDKRDMEKEATGQSSDDGFCSGKELSDDPTTGSTGSTGTSDSEGEDEKPPHSFVALISMAILSTDTRKMLLGDIYQYIQDNYPYYRNQGDRAWRNSVRHNLSLNDCFIKAGRADTNKGHFWSIHPNCIDDFAQGDYRRRQARRRTRRRPPSSAHVGNYVQMTSVPTHVSQRSQSRCNQTPRGTGLGASTALMGVGPIGTGPIGTGNNIMEPGHMGTGHMGTEVLVSGPIGTEHNGPGPVAMGSMGTGQLGSRCSGPASTGPSSGYYGERLQLYPWPMSYSYNATISCTYNALPHMPSDYYMPSSYQNWGMPTYEECLQGINDLPSLKEAVLGLSALAN